MTILNNPHFLAQNGDVTKPALMSIRRWPHGFRLSLSHASMNELHFG